MMVAETKDFDCLVVKMFLGAGAYFQISLIAFEVLVLKQITCIFNFPKPKCAFQKMCHF